MRIRRITISVAFAAGLATRPPRRNTIPLLAAFTVLADLRGNRPISSMIFTLRLVANIRNLCRRGGCRTQV
jgi:hypothetical protein